MNFCIAIGLAVSLLVPGNAPNDDKALQGTWKLVHWEVFNKTLADDRINGGKLVIKGDRYTVTLAGRNPMMGTQRLNPTKKPKTIDVIDTSGPYAGRMCHGIYEIKEDQFRVVFAPPGRARPKHFKVLDDGQWMHVWKHVTQ